ncbi:radical SAM/SPASM domain-containing protein [Treponema socranskii]|uniref:radical SAM/SPASM domain-containing protein n=1 Tax=Treponema socranskii TaxID=53419 RepID=UPI0028EF4549|nr:radical SAM protein [Treponema socranskii]
MAQQYFAFQWHITDECDQRCKHCYIFAEGHPALVTMNRVRIEHVFFNALEFCQKFDRLPYFYITGGDPILHPHFWFLLSLMKEHDIPFTLMGNPFHLTDEVCRKMRDYGCDKYQMSIDGMEHTHDWFRKPGSFNATLEKIKVINDAGITSVIMTTVSGTNIDEIPAVIDAVVRAEAQVYAFARYVPTSDGKGNEKSDWYIAPERYRDFLERIDKIYTDYEERGCKTYFNRKDHLWTLFDYEHGRFELPAHTPADKAASASGTSDAGTVSDPSIFGVGYNFDKVIIYGGCNCGNCHITILPTGDIYACRRVANSRVGNAYTDRLADVWTGKKMKAYRDYGKFNKCSKCELLPYCRGCPAVASGSSGGDFYAADPQCWKEVV